MKFFRIIIFIFLTMPLMLLLSGCFGDAIFDAIKAEEDYVAPFTVVLSENEAKRTTYFEIADTDNDVSLKDGDDSTYENIPLKRSFFERLNVNSTLDDVVDDNVTGLTWTRCTLPGFDLAMKTDDDCSGESVKMTWNQAVTACKKLNGEEESDPGYAGYKDWRLPTLSELLTLIKMDNKGNNEKNGENETDNDGETKDTHYADLDIFPNTKVEEDDAYWTYTSKLTISSDAMDVADYGWIVYFGGGGWGGMQVTNYIKKLDYAEGTGDTIPATAYVRCVRGGIN
ncbi:MAG: DUF1566 domain-containing protein [Spirochaetota bacterium]